MEDIRLVLQRSSSVCFALNPSQATKFFDRLGTNKILLIDAGSCPHSAVVKAILGGGQSIKDVSQAR